MITSIFSKSKPINFLIVFSITLLAMLVAVFRYNTEALNTTSILVLIAVFLCCFLSVLLIDFIVTKNALSQKGNAEVFIFSVFLLSVPQVFLNWEIVISNFLVLLALRRIISLRTLNEQTKKLFDAGFLIGLASLFYSWAILFFLLIYIALVFYAETKLKKWIVPFIGLSTILIISISLSILLNNNFYSILNTNFIIDLDFNVYNSIQFITVIIMLLSFGLWSSLFYLKNINKKKKIFRPSYKVVFVACMFATLLILISPKKDGSLFLFLFAPLAIIISNYIETITQKWFKTLFVLLLILFPITLLVL